MPAALIHKLIQPIPNDGYLYNLILCWRHFGVPERETLQPIQYTININNATCSYCTNLWSEGVYT